MSHKETSKHWRYFLVCRILSIMKLPSPWPFSKCIQSFPVVEPSLHHCIIEYECFGNCPHELKHVSTNFYKKNLTNPFCLYWVQKGLVLNLQKAYHPSIYETTHFQNNQLRRLKKMYISPLTVQVPVSQPLS